MTVIRVASTASLPIRLSVLSSEPVVAKLAVMPGPQGAQGPEGPDPWLEPIQDLTASGSLIVDYALGKHVRLNLTGDVTSFSVIGWPASNRIARLTLEILNAGDFGILAWPPGTLWQAGSVAQITRGLSARDRIILSTTDAGATVYGDPIGFDYR